MVDNAGKAQTVLGLVDPEQLGITLTHEHILSDFNPSRRMPVEASRRGKALQPVHMENLWEIWQRRGNLDDTGLLDEGEAIEEIALFKRAGGGAIVEATNTGIGRDPSGLARIARATGLHIVMGAGYYSMEVPQPGLAEKPQDEITREIIRDIREGFGWPPVRAGIIGEIASSWPRHSDEEKSLRAAVDAQRETGAPLLVHPGRNERAPVELMELIVAAGGDPARTIMSHIDRTIFDYRTLEEMARTGCYIEYDLFGQEAAHYPYNPSVYMPNDAKRVDDLIWLIGRGYLDRIVVSHDIASKHHLRRYGGHGYAHLIESVVPMMLRKGMAIDQVEAIFIRNPGRILAFR